MVRPEVLRKRLQKLGDYLSFLEGCRNYSLEEFMDDPHRYGSVERFLQLSIEAVNDIGSHIIADENYGPVNRAADIPILLEQQELIDSAARDVWIRMIGFRNILVHDYLDVDRTIVYQVLQENVNDLRMLMKAFSIFL